MGNKIVNADSSIENIEKAAELTAVFLVPFVLAVVLFIVPQGVNSAITINSIILNNTTKAAIFHYSQYTEFFKSLFNNLSFIAIIIFAILTWLFLVIYYLFERSKLLPLKLSIVTSGITILSAICLLRDYSNFLYSINYTPIFVILFAAVIAYWCFCICAFYRIKLKHPKS
ncbi:hypothetical protein M1278_03170 [Candidatus Marsarchaeota archaeon]|nr:hypothetical protein [Candidatus Marsarchaeota archaeon]